MIKKYIILTILIIATGCTKKTFKKNQEESLNQETIKVSKPRSILQTDIEDFIDSVYGKNGANLSLDQIFTIQDLLQLILHISEKEQKYVAAVTAQLLEAQNKNYSNIQQLANTYIISYLKEFAYLPHDLANYEPNIIEIADKIIKYIELEQTAIFNNQKTKHLFVTVSNRQAKNNQQTKLNKLPSVINFWQTPVGEQILNHYDPSDPVKIQWMAEMAMDMSVMLLAMQGASIANAHITTEGALLSKKISKDSQTIQTSLQSFQTKAQTNQQTKLQSMITAFSNAQEEIQSKTQQASQILNLELDHLYKNISINEPQQNYIFNQIQFDQLFSLGTMFTPQGVLWKNPFSIGDWEYESNDDSFWQYQNSPIFNDAIDEAGKKEKSSLQAENNAIFTEYFTNASSYTIAGSISLHRIDYPFFTGVIFNKARWISGDFESIRKSRMIGIYGASATDVGIYFAQQYTMNEEELKISQSDEPIQTPLQQIINKKVNKRINLPGNIFTNLENSPLTFNFEIINAPTTVTLKLWTDNNAPITTTINNLDPALYMYHGIGFACPGAVAQFKLTKPKDLIFSSQALSNYEKDLNSDNNQKGLGL